MPCHVDFATAASSMISAADRRRRTRAPTPNGSVSVGPVGMTRRQAIQYRTTESRPARGGRSPRGRAAARLVAARQLSRRCAAARASRPAGRSCVSIRSSRYGRSATSSMNRTQPAGGSNAYGVPSDATSCVSVPPTSRPRASPGRMVSSDGADLSERHRLRHAAQKGVAVVAGRAAREAAFDHRPVKRHQAARLRQPDQQRVLSL